MTLLELVIAALATWRVAHLFAKERGPWAILWRFRRWVGPRDGVAEDAQRLRAETDQLLDCMFCATLWIALPMLMLVHVAPALVGILAISAGAMLAEAIIGGRG